MKQKREVSLLTATLVILAVLAIAGWLLWWKTQPPSGDIQVSDQEWQQRYQQMLRSGEPYHPPVTQQTR